MLLHLLLVAHMVSHAVFVVNFLIDVVAVITTAQQVDFGIFLSHYVLNCLSLITCSIG